MRITLKGQSDRVRMSRNRDIAPGLLSRFSGSAPRRHARFYYPKQRGKKATTRLISHLPHDPGQQTGGSVPHRDTCTRSVCPLCYISKRQLAHGDRYLAAAKPAQGTMCAVHLILLLISPSPCPTDISYLSIKILI